MNYLKYTDRDVREMPNARELVENYLEDYSGSFDFLVDCRIRLMEGDELSVGMVRGVLNCMRNDPRISGLPEPSAEIIPISGRKKKNEDDWWVSKDSHCGDEESHIPHTFDIKKKKGKKTEWCTGTPFEINREYEIAVPALVKTPYVLAKYARAMIHRVSPEGPHYTIWAIPLLGGGSQHEYGPRECRETNVKLMCRYPSRLRNPILLDQNETLSLMIAEVDPIPLCVHCEEINTENFRAEGDS